MKKNSNLWLFDSIQWSLKKKSKNVLSRHLHLHPNVNHKYDKIDIQKISTRTRTNNRTRRCRSTRVSFSTKASSFAKSTKTTNSHISTPYYMVAGTNWHNRYCVCIQSFIQHLLGQYTQFLLNLKFHHLYIAYSKKCSLRNNSANMMNNTDIIYKNALVRTQSWTMIAIRKSTKMLLKKHVATTVRHG